MKTTHLLTALKVAAALVSLSGGGLSAASDAKTYSLEFNTNRYTLKTLKWDGQSITYRAYEGVVYVANPVDIRYQSLNFYVPEQYYEGKSLNGYTAETAPIFLPNSVGGYLPGAPASPALRGSFGPPGGPGAQGRQTPPENPANPIGPARPNEAGGPSRPPGPPGEPGDHGGFDAPGGPDKSAPPGEPKGPGGQAGPRASDARDAAGPPDAKAAPNALAVALSRGLVVAAPGARGRTLQNQQGAGTGKAPACIVDLKAAVRYLRHNDKVMPGDANKIISNGTSAGGALSALLGATGNSADYEPYLRELGAAEAPDNIFAASCYCPITDLDHADAAYEWLFNGLNTCNSRGATRNLTAGQIQTSAELKAIFPAYVNSLGLTRPDGTPLALDEHGDGTFKDYVKSWVVASAQKAMKEGKNLSTVGWLSVSNRTVTDLDFTRYVANATRMKTPPAFDSLDNTSPEVNLFGTTSVNNQHFTAYSKEHSADHSLADARIIRMMNPLNYIGAKGAITAPNWRIRHGTVDRDTSLAVPVILATRLQNTGRNVDFAMPWAKGHAGDYDLEELFAWIEQISR